MENVIESEDYQNYVPEDYDDLLKNLTNSRQIHESEEGEFSLDDHLKTLDDAHLETQVAGILIHLTDSTENPDEYSMY